MATPISLPSQLHEFVAALEATDLLPNSLILFPGSFWKELSYAEQRGIDTILSQLRKEHIYVAWVWPKVAPLALMSSIYFITDHGSAIACGGKKYQTINSTTEFEALKAGIKADLTVTSSDGALTIQLISDADKRETTGWLNQRNEAFLWEEKGKELIVMRKDAVHASVEFLEKYLNTQFFIYVGPEPKQAGVLGPYVAGLNPKNKIILEDMDLLSKPSKDSIMGWKWLVQKYDAEINNPEGGYCRYIKTILGQAFPIPKALAAYPRVVTTVRKRSRTLVLLPADYYCELNKADEAILNGAKALQPAGIYFAWLWSQTAGVDTLPGAIPVITECAALVKYKGETVEVGRWPLFHALDDVLALTPWVGRTWYSPGCISFEARGDKSALTKLLEPFQEEFIWDIHNNGPLRWTALVMRKGAVAAAIQYLTSKFNISQVVFIGKKDLDCAGVTGPYLRSLSDANAMFSEKWGDVLRAFVKLAENVGLGD